MKKLLTILATICFSICSYAQKQGNIWYFGYQAGLDFNSGTPVPLTNGQTYSPDGTPIEGAATISDSSGSLLFYTNGNKIWNKNQQVMPHGDSLYSDFSSTQAALIIAQPGSSRYFYVFTVDDFYEDHLKYGFRYSMVDMCLDSGLGDVIPNQKNILLLDTVAEKLTAVRHANGIDYWIIVHKYFSTAFYAYHLSAIGITDTVVSYIGSRHPTGSGVGAAIGELKASPNGQKLAIVNGQDSVDIAEYFNFDNNTGIVSNCVSIQTGRYYSYYGVSFSPDNSKLYIACWLNNNGVYQFDLNAGSGNPDSVIASKTSLAPNWHGFYGLQLANNGKIYVETTGKNAYLGVINYPNNKGISCNFVDSAIYLNSTYGGYGLPNFIDSYSYSNTMNNCTLDGVTNIKENNEVNIFPNPNKGIFTIKTSEGKENTYIEIYDMLGERIYQTNLAHEITDIKLNNQPAGLYLYRVILSDGNLSSSGKIIIQ